MFHLAQPPLEPLRLPGLADAAVLRLDRVDPLITGNKAYKLEGYLHAAERAGCSGLISLGGAHSNHLHALAAAGQRLGFQTVGLLRGEPVDTPTVRDLRAWGMGLHWLGYGGYRARHQPDFWEPWRARYPQLYPVPEGGAGPLGEAGCARLVEQALAQLPALGWDDFDAWWLAAGTGTTAAGIARADARPVYAAMAVPPGQGVEQVVQGLGVELVNAARAGFGRSDAQLEAFVAKCALPVEPVYTGKALMALLQHPVAAQRVLVIHTGGIRTEPSAGSGGLLAIDPA
ncbi:MULTISPECIES: 1-aminocyclopropane-1-carboxylate deaminase/D-cysteine desulfhydrase [unclassified Pseudomonas]|uniref:1-aminocyclopropane-1-carboxylate deaminase/D-cysteine desulfhydrase n=1 Tax=unclassified Pseudomonas TaxID=196821 RepID=UPI000BCD3CAB|nr:MULTISPECIES: pyridoxal-phosphate dependent enzyme [unclassified Pseudomonas]PVZ13869.1 1-aminocyclopropane-1-carboxylate deaminase [Pseudomonas sp. URIL14HWK12:I12]PVZ24175.1 1-aminocyclopropane-1-carboxylate deaminase [Pseudomonas sp. URIL14HWK12:I10]PVZ33186.1 1-aminocyclopropane-1-carboxylate deaminase [Pseudomonas sp. URIL14HWK12:I11]SNZ10648.1 1-aminocyclopropane-1-carboxylate deaminase [Pseudomonas sp. URIL14HWK12:I9]